jgi:3-hydroxyisobutyrate dehydrogenase-like beta-hydroxyacid dehydrogenase
MALGQATIPVAGPADAVARVLPLLEATSTGVFEFGEDPGAANVAKLGGNFLIAAAIESMAESLALAEANGVDRVQMMTMLNSTIFDCLIYKGYGQRVAERDHTPYPDAHFSLEVSRPASKQAGGQAKREARWAATTEHAWWGCLLHGFTVGTQRRELGIIDGSPI